MPLVNTGVSVSQEENLITAAKEAAQKAKEKLGGKKPKLLLFFCTFNYPKEQHKKAMDEIYSVFGDKSIPLAGGPVMGFFAEGKYFFDVGLFKRGLSLFLKGVEKVLKPLRFYGAVVVALESDYLNIGIGKGGDVFNKPEEAGKQAINEALDSLQYNPSVAYLAMMKKGAKDITRFRPINGFLLTPGNSPTGALVDQGIVDGITSITKRSVRIAGGGLCAGVKMKKEGTTYASHSIQFINGRVYSDSVVVVVFGSDLEIGYGTAIGTKSLNKVMFVTKSEGQIVHEIDGKPAKERLDEIYKEAGYPEGSFATGMYNGVFPAVPEGISGFLWPVIPIKFSGKKVIFMSPVRENTTLVLSKLDKKSAQEATRKATELMVEDAQTNDFGFIMFASCPVRAQIMGTKYTKEIDLIEEELKVKNIPVLGLCSSGEVAFYKLGSPFGATATITLMGVSNSLISEVKR